MDINDFRYMRQGQQLSDLAAQDAFLLKPLNHYTKKKERALLLIHGFSSSPAVYRYLIPQIHHYDAIVCPVLPGHADSIDAFAQIKASDWFHAAQTLCASLVKEYQQVDVLGLSLGGLIAYDLGQMYPLHHLYLLAPALKLQMRTNIMLNTARLFKALGFVHLRNAAGDLLNLDHAEISYRKLPLTTIIEMLQLAQHYQWHAPKCPIDLFLGAHDQVVNSKAVEQLFLPSNNTRIHWLDHSAHVLPLDNDLDVIIQCINKNGSLA